MPKGSTPWSTRTIAEGGTDSPVGDLVPVPDSAQPVINAGFIDDSGKWQLAAAANDRAFTFQDPAQALAAGASLYIEGINMLNHDILILGILDSSGNNINIDIFYMCGLAGITGTPYNDTGFDVAGFAEDRTWHSNDPGDGAANLVPILEDGGEALQATWRFYKIGFVRGTVGQLLIRSNEGANAGTISTAYLRLV